MKALEERAFAEGVSAETLMEEVGAQIAETVQRYFPQPGRCAVHFGKGHNGGDALVAARVLVSLGWTLDVRPAFPEAEWSELTGRKYRQLGEWSGSGWHVLEKERNETFIAGRLIVLDGLLGIGAGGALREPILSAAREINRLRDEDNAHVFAIDVPTGLDGDTGIAQADAVRADFTLTIGFAKRGLVADSATPHVGRLAVLPLRELTARAAGAGADPALVSSVAELAPLLPRRRFDVHKGDFGRIGIVAGSRGLTGAAILAAEACVRAGAGLVSLYVTEDIHAIVASSTSAEVMVKPIGSYLDVLDTNRDVLAVGPGLGTHRREEALELIRRAEQPMIIDADGLNVLSTDLGTLDSCAGARLLTPHPGEMARLDPDFKSRSRREAVDAFTARSPHALLLKGSRTIIGQRGRPVAYNTTGSAGMSTGGMGDVLTGVCAALAGHGLTLYDAARVASWLCGRAAELAIYHGRDSEESFSANTLLDWLGPAFRALRGESTPAL